MRAWIGERIEKSARWHLAELPEPRPRAGEVLIRVRAVGLNRVDQWPKTSHFSHSDPAPAAIPGLECAGEIAALGEGVTDRRIGERVMAMVQGGAAETVRVHAALTMPVPQAMAWTSAAALPVSYLTAHDALIGQGRLQNGGNVLIHAVSSGVGIAALQIARLRGARFIAGSSGSAEKLDRLARPARPDGLDLALLDPYAGFADRLLEATAGHGADVVIDHIGGRILDETIRATALGGRVIDVGRFGGTRAEIDLDQLAVRRVSLIGVTFRTRTLAEHRAVIDAFLTDHADDLAQGRLAPVIDGVFAFDALPEAMARSASRAQFGKIVLAF